MRIAIPLADGKLAAHFGHCEHFALVDVDPHQRLVLATELVAAPPHEPGKLPDWLAQFGTEVIIAGGMGTRAMTMFDSRDINVVTGAPREAPESIARAFLLGTLTTGSNLCDH